MVALAILLWIPQGISEETTPVVTGHSTFYNGDVYDQCLASIAGILRSRVMWFNDQVLVERYPGKGTYVFVTEAGAPDPTKATHFYHEGVTYDFKDPNGAAWLIYEAYYVATPDADADKDPYTGLDPTTGWKVQASLDKTYVWFVEISAQPILDQFPGEDYPHSIYNFLVLVDTCKFHRYDAVKGPIAHHNDSAILNEDHGHPNDATNHTHETWNADIWVGKRPVMVNAPPTEDTSKESSNWVSFEEDPGRPNDDGKSYEG